MVRMRRARPGALAVALTLAACGSATAPRLEMEGAGPLDGAGTVRIRIANVGGRPLLVHGLVPACGCRLAAPLADTLGAGERVEVVLVCRAEPSSRDSLLFTNDPVTPVARIPAPATVARNAADPAALYLGYVPVGGTLAREVAIEPEATVVAADPVIRIEPESPRADGWRVYRVSATPAGSGVFRAALDLGPGRLPVAVSGVAFRRVAAFPPEVVLPSLTTAGPPVLTLANLGDEPLEITAVELPSALAGEIAVVLAGREFRLPLRLRGLPAPGAIRIHTSAPEEPIVEIPVRLAGAS